MTKEEIIKELATAQDNRSWAIQFLALAFTEKHFRKQGANLSDLMLILLEKIDRKDVK